MTQSPAPQSTSNLALRRSDFLDSVTDAQLAGVRTRRVAAFAFDLTVIAIIAAILYLGTGIVTFGLAWLLLPPLFPIIAFLYNGLSMSGRNQATPGMRLANLRVRRADGGPVRFIEAALHAVLFYVIGTIFFPAPLASFVTEDKRCLHDMLAGVIFLRRDA